MKLEMIDFAEPKRWGRKQMSKWIREFLCALESDETNKEINMGI